MNSRIKSIRTTLNLTQTQFGSQLGLAPNSICDLENGRYKINDRLILAICGKFNINENWLRTGVGEMFNNNKTYKDFYNIFSELSPALQEFIVQSAKHLLNIQSDLNEK